MKKTIVTFFTLIVFLSCSTNDAKPEINITSPAAYVINGESTTITVIDLASNVVKNTIVLDN